MISNGSSQQYSPVLVVAFYGLLLLRFVSDSLHSSSINIVINLALLSVAILTVFASKVPLLKTEFRYQWMGVVSFVVLFLLNIGFDLNFTLSEFFRVFFLVMLVNVFYLMFRRGFFSNTLSAFLLINIALILIGFLKIALGDYRVVEGAMRLNGTYSHPNPYGMHLMLIFMFCLGLYVSGYSKKIMSLTCVSAFIVFTQIFNFSSLLAVVLFAGLYLFFENRHKWSLVHYVLYPVVAFASFYLLYLISPVLGERVDLLIDTGLVSDLGYAVNSVQWRVMNWSYYLSNIDNLFLGGGVGSSDSFYKMRHYTLFTVLAPHNEWLKILFEYGVLGVLTLVGVFVHIFSKVGVLSRSLIIAFLFACFFDNFFKATSLIILVVLLVLFFEESRRRSEYL
ncbi:MAG: hypothetical protein RPR97_17825 [Colwellia sp.]